MPKGPRAANVSMGAGDTSMDSVLRRTAAGSYGLALGFGLSQMVTHNHALGIGAILSAALAVILTHRYGLLS